MDIAAIKFSVSHVTGITDAGGEAALTGRADPEVFDLADIFLDPLVTTIGDITKNELRLFGTAFRSKLKMGN